MLDYFADGLSQIYSEGRPWDTNNHCFCGYNSDTNDELDFPTQSYVKLHFIVHFSLTLYFVFQVNHPSILIAPVIWEKWFYIRKSLPFDRQVPHTLSLSQINIFTRFRSVMFEGAGSRCLKLIFIVFASLLTSVFQFVRVYCQYYCERSSPSSLGLLL